MPKRPQIKEKPLTKEQKSIITERRQTCKHCLSKCLGLGGILLKDQNACLSCAHYQTMTVDEKIDLYSRNLTECRDSQESLLCKVR